MTQQPCHPHHNAAIHGTSRNYQKTVLSMSPTEILIGLNIPLHVVQQALQSWDEIEVVVRELKKLGWAHVMMTDQVSVSKTKLSRCL